MDPLVDGAWVDTSSLACIIVKRNSVLAMADDNESKMRELTLNGALVL